MSRAGVPPVYISVSDLFPVPGFHMQLHQSLQVSHLGISLWGIAMVLQPLEVESTFWQQLTFSLVQLPSDVDQPEWEEEKRMAVCRNTLKWRSVVQSYDHNPLKMWISQGHSDCCCHCIWFGLKSSKIVQLLYLLHWPSSRTTGG